MELVESPYLEHLEGVVNEIRSVILKAKENIPDGDHSILYDVLRHYKRMTQKFYSRIGNYNFQPTYKDAVERKLKNQVILYVCAINGYIIFENHHDEEKFFLEHMNAYAEHYVYYQFNDTYKRLPFSMVLDRTDDTVQQTKILDLIEGVNIHIQNCHVPKLGYKYVCFRLTVGGYDSNIEWGKILPNLFID